MREKFPPLSLVLGGARSGKSGFAEQLVRAAGSPKTYFATAQVLDDEMAARIARHRRERGDDWTTVEVATDLAQAVEQVVPDGIVLVDCLTLWLSNLMLAGADAADETDRLLGALSAARCPVVCVSNEVGMGLVPDTPLGRRFRDAQGRLNRLVAAQADLAVFVAAGLPVVLKGALPVGGGR